MSDPYSRNTPRGIGRVGGAWGGSCDSAPDGNIMGHYHCEQCRVCLLEGQRFDARYCSSACRQRAYRQRQHTAQAGEDA